MRDFSDAKLWAESKEKGVPADPCSLAFYPSTDGVCLFRKDKQTVHPLILINYNLHPPNRNVIYLGVVPGPKKPSDLHSFLRSVVDEFKLLVAGVPTTAISHLLSPHTASGLLSRS